MRHERIDVWGDDEYRYPASFGFRPNLRTYLHEDGEARPCVLVIPGGGYRMVVPSEGEIVAKWFYNHGYQTFVGTYTTDYLGMNPLKTQPLKDLARMVRLIRSRADAFGIREGKIILCGFSAGAHLCGSLCVHWTDAEDPAYINISCRPDGAILSYPVITSGEYAHRDSFTALLGENAAEEELAYMSLEKQVTDQTPPVFLWQTATDETVPVENSYLMAMALKKAGIPMEHHVFPRGSHGLSLSNEDWAERRFGDPYSMEQMFCIAKAAEDKKITAAPEKLGMLHFFLHPDEETSAAMPKLQPVEEAAVWPELADRWIRNSCL